MKQNTHFDEIICYLSNPIRNTLSALSPFIKNSVQEVRIRQGMPLSICVGKQQIFIDNAGKTLSTPFDMGAYRCTKLDIEETFRSLCNYSVHSHMDQIKQGYITLPKGDRAGICGTAIMSENEIINISPISSINLRIARDVKGCSDEIVKNIMQTGMQGTLIVGPPSSGKTTLLKDLARQLSDGGTGKFLKVCIVDERCEIAGTYMGQANTKIGISTDILNGYKKSVGIAIATRTMSPEVILCDEIGGNDEISAVMDSILSGVHIITTVHAANMEEFYQKPQVKQLIATGAFQKLVLLDPINVGKINLISPIRR